MTPRESRSPINRWTYTSRKNNSAYKTQYGRVEFRPAHPTKTNLHDRQIVDNKKKIREQSENDKAPSDKMKWDVQNARPTAPFAVFALCRRKLRRRERKRRILRRFSWSPAERRLCLHPERFFKKTVLLGFVASEKSCICRTASHFFGIFFRVIDKIRI